MKRLTENQWIEYFGFQRFPFDRPEAGNEEFARPDFLSICFVEPTCFERVLGQADAPVTTLLFAARGTGKTACRVMVDYYCKRGEVNRDRVRDFDQPSYVLSVPHIHLHQVLNMARQETPSTGTSNVRVEHHAIEILRRAVPALVELVANGPELGDKVKNLALAERQDLSWLILNYSHYLTLVQAGFLHGLEILPFDNRPPIGFQTRRHPSTRQSPWLYALWQSRSQVSPLDHLSQWANLMRRIGIQATYALVDGVDEFEESAANPLTAFEIVRPLLSSLRLMDGTPYFALKFFLPAHIEPLVRADEAVRSDRGFIFESIIWQEADLIKILRSRLAVLKREEDKNKDRLEVGFDALCVPELRGQIESDLARWAKGNPRHLMIICGLMVTAHCTGDIQNQDDPYQLTKLDLQIALEQFETRVGLSKPSFEVSRRLHIRDLIAGGENEQVEFKSSLRWDFKTNGVNKNLKQEIIRSVAGMLNNKGGVLLIGVADDGTILGIEKDLQTLKKKNMDGFQLALIDAVETHLRIDDAACLQVGFEQEEGKWVCVVLIEKSPKPVYFTADGPNEFWVRIGNSTRQLDVKAALSYIQSHWKKVG